MHLEQTGNTFFFIGTRIVYIRTGFYFTGINPGITQTSYERIGCDLKGQCRKRSFGVYRKIYFFSRTGICSLTIRDIQRIRQISDHCIQQILNPFILKRRTAHHRTEIHSNHRFPDDSLQFFYGNRIRIFKETFHQSFVLNGSCFYQLFSPFLSFSHEIGRNILYRRIHRPILPQISFHFNQVDYAFEILFCSNRKLQGNGISS